MVILCASAMYGTIKLFTASCTKLSPVPELSKVPQVPFFNSVKFPVNGLSPFHKIAISPSLPIKSFQLISFPFDTRILLFPPMSCG